MSNLKYINDDEEFNAMMKTAKADLVVVDFYTTWCGPCRQMEPVIESMVMKHPKVWFLKVDADKCFETAMAHGVKGVPLFVIYMDKMIMDTIQGAHPQLLDQKVAYYVQELKKSFPSVHQLPADDRLNQMSQVISSIGRIRDVTPYLDEKGCRCINDLTPTAFDGFVNGKKLSSGKGTGKLVLVYSFKQRLMLHSFKIKAHAETGPKVLRIFVNHPKLLDFAVGSQLAPAQEVTLSPDDLQGDRVIELRTSSFTLVSNLQIFVTEGMTKGHHRIDIDSLTLFGAPVEMSKKLSSASVGFNTIDASGQSNANANTNAVANYHHVHQGNPTHNNHQQFHMNDDIDTRGGNAKYLTPIVHLPALPATATPIEYIPVDNGGINHQPHNHHNHEDHDSTNKRNILAAKQSKKSNKSPGSSKKKGKKLFR